MQFSSGALHATIDPRNLDHGVLQRADLFVLRMIQDAWPERPIYFARTSGGYARSLGLGDNVLTQGLASKLFIAAGARRGEGHASTSRATDGSTCRAAIALWNDVFLGPQSVLNTGDWIDRPSVGIPYLYVATGMELAEALKTRGKIAEAQKVFNQAKQVAKAVRLDDLVRGAEAEFAQPVGDTAAAQLLPKPPAAAQTSPAPPGGKAPAAPPKGKTP